MQNLNFSTAELQDAESLVHLVNIAYRPPQGKGGWTHEATLVAGARTDLRQMQTLILHDKTEVLLAKEADVIVGCVYVVHDNTQCHIGMLAVAPDMQSKGIGKALFQHAENYAIDTYKPSRLVILVVSDRPELQAFYGSLGYQLTGQTMPYPIDAGVGIPKSDSLELIMMAKVSRQAMEEYLTEV